MATVSHAPAIRRVKAYNSNYDPMHQSVFEVRFSVPSGISSKVNAEDIAILSEQVTKVDGLDALQILPEVSTQKFLGADLSYINTTPSQTYAEITIDMNLNLRNATDAYVFRIFKEWGKLNFDIKNGTRALTADAIAPYLEINEANRDTIIWRQIKLYRVILVSISGLDSLDYTNSEARQLQVKFRSDCWDDDYDTNQQ